MTFSATELLSLLVVMGGFALFFMPFFAPLSSGSLTPPPVLSVVPELVVVFGAHPLAASACHLSFAAKLSCFGSFVVQNVIGVLAIARCAEIALMSTALYICVWCTYASTCTASAALCVHELQAVVTTGVAVDSQAI
jgi:hypothetical protein